MPQNQLHDGLRLLQQPYSEALAEAALDFLEAVNPRVQGRRSVDQDASEVPEMLGLLNMYLQWFLSGVPAQLSEAQAATSSSDDFCLPGIDHTLSRGLALCLTHMDNVLVEAASAHSQQVEAAVRPHLVAQGTGERLCACVGQYRRDTLLLSICRTWMLTAITVRWGTGSLVCRQRSRPHHTSMACC
jgi:hypothetical protein